MFTKFLTQSANHIRSDGLNLNYITYGLACTPADPLGENSMSELYPNEKLLSFRQVFTNYASFLDGDYLEMNSKRYAVRVVNEYESLNPMEDYVQLIVEEVRGS